MHTMYRSLLTQFSVLLHIFQMRFKGSISDNWWCEGSQQIRKTAQVTTRMIAFPDASYRNNEDGASHRDMAVFLSESRERSTKDKMSYGNLIEFESQRIKRTVLFTTGAELFPFMKCFASYQFLRGLWMDLSDKVAKIHMRIDAKNLVRTARTIHLPDKSDSSHDLHVGKGSLFSKYSWSSAVKASAKAINLITAVKTGKLSEVDIHSNCRPLMEHKAFLSTWCQTFIHTREKDVFFLNTLWKCFSHRLHKKDIPYDVREKKTCSRTKTTDGVRLESFAVECYCDSSTYFGTRSWFGIAEENVWIWRSECYENNVCSRRQTFGPSDQWHQVL